MPTYEYRCPEGHDSEDFVLKISDAKSEIPCPTCGAAASRRVSAGSGLLFKGSGFYITDYGKDGKKDQRAGAEKSGGSSAKSSTTPATPAPAAAAPAVSSTPSTGSSGKSGSSGSSGSSGASSAS